MIFVIIIYHLSTYLFTKDKSFLLYSIYLLIISVFLVNIIDNPISNYIRNSFSTFFTHAFWLIPVWFWMLLSLFFLEFLNIKKENYQLYKTTLFYVKTNLLVFTSFWIIDFIFFNSKYYFEYCVDTFLYVGIVYSFYVLIKIIHIKNKLLPLFLTGFIIAFLVSVNFHFSYYIFPNNALNRLVNYKTLFVVGFSLKMIIMSIALNYKYHLFRIKRKRLNTRLINELQKNEKLKTQVNQFLNKKNEDINTKLKLVAFEAEKNKLTQIETAYKKEIAQLKLSNLLSHINPHFVFNSLNSIKLFIIQKDQKRATFYLNKFSKLIRKILDASNNATTTLTEELKTMRLYTSIENIRFNNEIKFHFKVDKKVNTDKIKVPPLILHPFIENAIWHGVSSLKTTKIISIKVKEKTKFIVFKIQDNGIGIKKASKIESTKTIKRTGFGIKATRERLDDFYKKYSLDYELIISDLEAPENGTLVTLKIPKNYA